MEIAQTLQKLMKERGLSNSKLAREIGVHTSTVSNWLDGKEIKSDNLNLLCEYFDCTLDYLTGKEDTKKAALERPHTTEDLLKILANLEQNKRHKAIVMTKGGSGQKVYEFTEAQLKALEPILEEFEKNKK